MIGALRDVVEAPYTIAAWLVAPEAELDDKTPIDELRRGRVKPVAEAVRRYAARLRQ